MRDLNRDEKAVLEAFRSAGAAFSASELASGDLTEAMVEKLRDGRQPLTVAKLRAMYRVARRRDPDAALALVAAVLGADDAGLVVSRAIEVHGTAEVRTEAMEAVVANSKMVEADLAGAPIEERLALAGRALRETTEAVRALQSQQAQPSLALVGGVR